MTMFGFSMVVATDQKWGIGKDNAIPWQLSSDMAYFKKLTATTQDPNKKNVVIMGRKTWESIPLSFRPLKKRVNVVLSRDLSFSLGSTAACTSVYSSFEQGLSFACKLQNEGVAERIFVIGGAQIYQQALAHELCQKIYQTCVFSTFSCDAFFPEHEFKLIHESPVQYEKNLSYSFHIYAK